MKKLKLFLSLFIAATIIPLNVQNASATSYDEVETYSYSLDSGINSISLNDIKSEINQPGNTVVFTGNDIDKLSLYKKVFEQLNLPLFLDNNEFKQLNPDAVIQNDEVTIDGQKNIVVPTKTTLIALYNSHGKIAVLENDEPIDNEAKQLKKFNSFVQTNDLASFINDFKNDMDKLFSSATEYTTNSNFAAAQQGDLLTSVRKTFSVNGTYKPSVNGSVVTFIAGKAVTDYLFYANSAKTHYYVLADSQIYPAGVADSNPNVWTSGYKSNIRTNSSSNYLINWSPNTTNLNLDNNTQYQVGISASKEGIELSFNYTWQGTSNTKMDAIGDKLTGLTTEYLYKSNNSSLASKSFTTGHGALINATNKILSFASSHQFRTQTLFTDGPTWYSTTATNLSYSP